MVEDDHLLCLHHDCVFNLLLLTRHGRTPGLLVLLRHEPHPDYVGAKILTDMLEDAETEIAFGLKGSYNFRSTLLDSYTKVLARQLMKELQENS